MSATLPARRPAAASVRLLGGRVSLRVRRRGLLSGAALLVVLLALVVLSLGTGDVAVAPGDVLAALVGGGDGGTAFVVRELRLPRLLLAVVVGVALGISGAIFQTITRNPLGSPDVIGFQGGAVVGALVVVTVVGSSSVLGAATGAVIGGAVTVVVVTALARRDGRTEIFRFVLIGIGATAFTRAIAEFLLSRARLEEAQEATRWTLGSLGSTTEWSTVVGVGLVVVVLCLLTPAATRALRAAELGDELAVALGLPLERARMLLVVLAIGLVGAATAAVGPILFVALLAPQVARRVAAAPGIPLAASGLMGAVIVVAGDLVSQEVLPRPLPVGIVTGTIGGAYLIALLTLSWRRSGRA